MLTFYSLARLGWGQAVWLAIIKGASTDPNKCRAQDP